jgi:hypothetical protein
MRKINYDYKKFHLKLEIPEEMELFMKAAHINENEVLNKDFWQMQAEDIVFLSHEKHPTEEGYISHGPDEYLSKSKHITVLLYGFYLTSKKILEFDPKEFNKSEPLTTSSCNLKSGWRIYFSFYD